MKFREGVYIIPGMYDSSVNMFLFQGEDGLTLVDSGGSSTPDNWIFPYMKAWGLKPELIKTLINTHAHIDHASGNSRVFEISHCKVAAHPLEKPGIENREIPINETMSFVKFVPSAQPEAVRKRISPLFGNNTKVDISIRDGDSVEGGKGKLLRVIHMPGHSAGSIGLYDDENHILYVGDSFQVGLKHLPFYNDVDAQIKTLNRLSQMKIDTAISAHFAPLRRKDVNTVIKRCEKLVEEIHEGTCKVIKSSSKPLSLFDIAKKVCTAFSYSCDPKELGVFFTLRTVKAHVDKLIADSEVKTKDVLI